MSGVRRRSGPWMWCLLAASLAGLGAGCRSDAQDENRLLIFAAASLRDAFEELRVGFEGANPGVRIEFGFAGSQELRTQIEHGARADVFASADRTHMAALEEGGRVTAPIVFARGEPVIVVAAKSAETIRRLEDLPAAGSVALAAKEVPIGHYAEQILDRASASDASFRSRVEAKVISRDLSVRQVLARVRMGEAEAGIVYRSDAAIAGDEVAVVEIPAELNVIASYPIAMLRDTRHPRLALAWIEHVLSAAGQRILGDAGLFPAATAERAAGGVDLRGAETGCPSCVRLKRGTGEERAP